MTARLSPEERSALLSVYSLSQGDTRAPVAVLQSLYKIELETMQSMAKKGLLSLNHHGVRVTGPALVQVEMSQQREDKIAASGRVRCHSCLSWHVPGEHGKYCSAECEAEDNAKEANNRTARLLRYSGRKAAGGRDVAEIDLDLAWTVARPQSEDLTHTSTHIRLLAKYDATHGKSRVRRAVGDLLCVRFPQLALTDDSEATHVTCKRCLELVEYIARKQ